MDRSPKRQKSNNSIVLDEETHKYNITNNDTGETHIAKISVSSVIKYVVPPFDPMILRWITSNARCPTVESKIAKRVEYLNKWEEARDYGTRVHQLIEDFLNNYTFNNTPTKGEELLKIFLGDDTENLQFTPEAKQFLRYYFDSLKRGWEFHKSEYPVYDEEYKLAGTIDAVFKKVDAKSGKTTYKIVDWKRSTTNFKRRGKVPFLGYPLSHVSNTKLEKYRIQLSLYNYILTRTEGWELSDDMSIVQMNPTKPGATIFSVKYNKDDVVNLLTYMKEQDENKRTFITPQLLTFGQLNITDEMPKDAKRSFFTVYMETTKHSKLSLYSPLTELSTLYIKFNDKKLVLYIKCKYSQHYKSIRERHATRKVRSKLEEPLEDALTKFRTFIIENTVAGSNPCLVCMNVWDTQQSLLKACHKAFGDWDLIMGLRLDYFSVFRYSKEIFPDVGLIYPTMPYSLDSLFQAYTNKTLEVFTGDTGGIIKPPLEKKEYQKIEKLDMFFKNAIFPVVDDIRKYTPSGLLNHLHTTEFRTIDWLTDEQVIRLCIKVHEECENMDILDDIPNVSTLTSRHIHKYLSYLIQRGQIEVKDQFVHLETLLRTTLQIVNDDKIMMLMSAILKVQPNVFANSTDSEGITVFPYTSGRPVAYYPLELSDEMAMMVFTELGYRTFHEIVQHVIQMNTPAKSKFFRAFNEITTTLATCDIVSSHTLNAKFIRKSIQNYAYW